MPRLPRRSAPLVALLGAALLATVPALPTVAAADDSGDRAEARVLDAVPLPPGADASRVGDRARQYTVAMSGTQVLAYLRTALPNAGWTERSAARGSTRTTGSNAGGQGDNGSGLATGRTDTTGGNGPEVGTRGPDDGGVDAGTDPTLAGNRLRAVFTRSGARLVVLVEDVPDALSPPSSSADAVEDLSTLRLKAHVRADDD